ncbi:phenylalanine and histidine ammonia-lyase [Aspergillus oryzae 100-8]|uniref:Phenylalanine and histidine ammonia-lyase n=1 Tax=Aspergillus oryzae (strain 3.042) TaxID=1160506 RepID=I8A2L9_ASPO3|nr:phenylalanine and histidine ammonia-lyase [Aspergillus oryzae 3.042]KDE82496.1 phenylalanine and histidine ammonia-lyase [Aspergillus oryzae 100-8]|eukprot:EIT78629.1 phenylalanine and histidine ammonia-lyase [Aspergillus oryzae 3.042]
MDLLNMGNLSDFQTHIQTAYQARQRLQNLQREGTLDVDGATLDISAIVAVAYYGCIPKITTDPAVLEKIEASVQVLRDHLDKGYHVYGVNTGFGGSADSRTDRVVALQSGLSQLLQAGVLVASDKDTNVDLERQIRLDSHAVPVPWVRAAMLVRCNSNARGHSAVTLSVIKSILQLLESHITPVVPLRGSISASGDLIPLSYIAGAIEGNPDVYVHVQKSHRSQIISSRDALLSAGMEPQVLGPKEGLGLVNGTSFSAALSSLVMYETHQLVVLVQAISAVALEALMGNAESFHPFISAIRPHDGQMECSRNILSFLQGSRLAQGIQSVKTHTRQGLMQDRYALRCVPQWIGPQLEDLLLAHKQVTVELNSTTDNPLIDPETGDILHGGNFQAVSVTSAMEKTRSCLQMLGRLLFSQSTELVDPSLNNGLPTNLVADDPSLSFTMKGVDISMASYMAELAYLANPVSSHVQAAEMRNQSINSMAFVSSRYTMQAVEIVSLMCACSLYIGCQALDLRVLHLTYLDNIKPQLHLLTSDLFSSYLSDKELETLTESLWENISKSWSTTTRQGIPERVQVAVKNAIPTLLDTLKEKRGPGLSDLNRWETQAADLLNKTYQNTADTFFNQQNTEEFLGAGAKILYRTVRQELNVPFHLGFVEHPTVNNETLNGRSKKTIGSWISIIYEAIRDGRLMGPFMESLASKSSSADDSLTKIRSLRMSRL